MIAFIFLMIRKMSPYRMSSHDCILIIFIELMSFHFIFLGKYCEHQTTVSFVDKKSFIQMKAPQMTSAVNLTLVFTTTSEQGVLLYLGESREHLAVELFQKRIRISFDCGNKPTSVMFR